ncbi:MAG: hypothetical protein HUU15_02335 [Candidatus Brocadiae bacterium]|nr:hypothetical protein [Candidatus Brocadiia bacterium]
MKMRMMLLMAVFLCAAGRGAVAQSQLPYGYEVVDKEKYVWLCAKGKKALTLTQKADIVDGLKQITGRFEKLYGLEHEIMRVGANGGLFKDMRRDPAILVVFPNLEEFQEWVGDAGVGGITVHLSRRLNLVGVPLEDGKITPETWHVLWHEFSHVYFHHYLALGGPIWLNEGLAEYFGVQNPHTRDNPAKNYQTMLAHLRKRRDDGAATPISALLGLPQSKFTRQHYDEAWLLVHMLMTEATSQLNDLMTLLTSMEADAWDGREGIERDLRTLARAVLEEVFGGTEALQRAWDKHLEAVLTNPDRTPRCNHPLRPAPKDPTRPSIDARLVGTAKTVEIDGVDYKARRPKGSVTYRASRPGTVRVTIQVGFANGRWSSDEWILVDSQTMKQGQKLEFKEIHIPAYEGGKTARLWVEWTPEGGGTYKTAKEWSFK